MMKTILFNKIKVMKPQLIRSSISQINLKESYRNIENVYGLSSCIHKQHNIGNSIKIA